MDLFITTFFGFRDASPQSQARKLMKLRKAYNQTTMAVHAKQHIRYNQVSSNATEAKLHLIPTMNLNECKRHTRIVPVRSYIARRNGRARPRSRLNDKRHFSFVCILAQPPFRCADFGRRQCTFGKERWISGVSFPKSAKLLQQKLQCSHGVLY